MDCWRCCLMQLLGQLSCLVIVVLITGPLEGGAESAPELQCAYLGLQSERDRLFENDYGMLQPDNVTITCRRDSREGGEDGDNDATIKMACYATWLAVETEQGFVDVKLVRQGCWPGGAQNRNCLDEKCMDHREAKLNNTRYCCCSSPMCNSEQNLTVGPPHTTLPSSTSTFQAAEAPATIFNWPAVSAVLGSLVFFCVLVVVAYFVYRFRALHHAPKHLLMAASGHAGSSVGGASRAMSPLTVTSGTPQFGSGMAADSLKMDSLLHRGKFGEVWHARLEGHGDVCAKIFSPAQRALFLNEKDIYSLPLMQHEALVRCFAAEERRVGSGPASFAITQYVIVMEYHPIGSLNAYLKGAKGGVSFQTLCAMGHSISAGLGYLHLEIGGPTAGNGDSGPYKPAVVHRDLNSRNILVKSDLTCAIADMGFALKIKGSKYTRTGQEDNAEEASLRDVGTVRYMAPEILDGAVNLRDCEASLKQIDVYALGLVLWEVAMQCNDLYLGNQATQAYRVPFEDEVGVHPTFEDMQVLVSKNRQRPTFPANWKDNQVTQSLRETIEDCWDYDAEARLTALCVQERFRELPHTFDSKSRPMSVLAVNQTGENKTRTSYGFADNLRSEHPAATSRDDAEETSPLLGMHTTAFSDSLSAVTTMTVLSLSDDGRQSNPNSAMAVANESHLKHDINIQLDQSRRQQQQQVTAANGRNSLISRNTRRLSDEEDSVAIVVGNTLVPRACPSPVRGLPSQGLRQPLNSCSIDVQSSGDRFLLAGSNCAAATGSSQQRRGEPQRSAALAAVFESNGQLPLQSRTPADGSGGHTAGNRIHCRSPSDGLVAAVANGNTFRECLSKKVPNEPSTGEGQQMATRVLSRAASLVESEASGSSGHQPLLRQHTVTASRPGSLALNTCK